MYVNPVNIIYSFYNTSLVRKMPGSLFLKGKLASLRTVEEEDLEFMVENINDPEVRSALTSHRPINKIEERKFLERISKSDDELHLLIWDVNDRIGMVSLFDIDHRIGSAEMGLWIIPDFWKKGYGTEASKLMMNYGFRELNLHKIVARTLKTNPASQKIWEKLDFEKEGVSKDAAFIDGEYVDMIRYSILKYEWEKSEE